MKNYWIVLILIVFISSCGNNDGKPAQDNDGSVNYISEVISITDDTLKYEMNVSYPQLTGSVDDSVKFRVNSFISKSVKVSMEFFREGLFDPDEFEELDFDYFNSYEVNDTIAILTNKLFSFYLSSYYYFAGAAHGNTNYLTYNFDLTDGHPIELEELFLDEVDYLKILSKLSMQNLMNELMDYSDEGWIAEGSGPNKDNFQNFVIMEDGILIIFEAYQVAPYVAGPQFVLIPYTEMNEVLDVIFLKKLGIETELVG